MAWFIDPDINDGYPWQEDWPQEAQTAFTGELPYSAWRIQADINDGYPWIWWWFKEDSSRSGEMLIGGSQTNYPSGFTSANRGGIRGQFDNNTMRYYGTGSVRAVAAINAGIGNRQFFINGSDLDGILSYINGNIDATLAAKIQSIYGASIYDAFLCCKAYPFELRPAGESTLAYVMLYNTVQVQSGVCLRADTCVSKISLGEITLDIRQAWEIESVDYSIYLPFAGTFPLDVRAGLTIRAELWVDYYHGYGEYFLYQNEQITGVHRAQIGVDVPINLTQGVANSNLASNIISTVTKGLPLAGAVVGSTLAGPAGATVGSAATGMLAGMMDKTMVSHDQVSAPQIGGLASMYSYPYARIIARIPKMFRDGYGYAEINGESRSCCYVQLSTCSGMVRTRGYKCDIIVATDDEKSEIESMMDAGVFL